MLRVESLRPGLEHRGDGWAIARWLEHPETAATPELVAGDGTVTSWRHGSRRYLGAWPDRALALTLLGRAAADAGLATHRLPEGLRLRRAGSCLFAFNYAAQAREIPESVSGHLLMGEQHLSPAGIAVLNDISFGGG